MDITTSSKRSFLEDAWDAAQVGVVSPAVPDLRAQLRTLESASKLAISGGSIASVTANGRSTVFALPSQATLTPKQIVELCRELIDLFGSSKKALNFAAKYGIDVSELDCQFVVSQLVAVEPAVIVDASEYFAPLCDEFDIDVAVIVGAAVSDSAVFLWMMGHLIPITEIRSDYSDMRSGGASWG